MSVRLAGDMIILEGVCRVEDAEPLLSLLQAGPGRIVDLTGVEHLHAAVLQVLMALGPALEGVCNDPFVRSWIAPILVAARPVPSSSGDG